MGRRRRASGRWSAAGRLAILVPILGVAAGCGVAPAATTAFECDDPVLVYPGGDRLSGYTVIESRPDVEPTTLTDESIPVFSPVISPDGSLIAVGYGGGSLEECCGYERSRVAVLDEAGDLRDLTAEGPGQLQNLQWSADGREIFYTRTGEDSLEELLAVDLEGGERAVLEFTEQIYQVAIEPDGTHALVTTETGLSRYDLADGSHEVLDIGVMGARSVRPGPAGSIAMIAQEGIYAYQGIYVYDPASGRSTQVYLRDGPDGGLPRALTWSGDQLVYNVAAYNPPRGFFMWDRPTGAVRELDRPGLDESVMAVGAPLSAPACSDTPTGEQPD